MTCRFWHAFFPKEMHIVLCVVFVVNALHDPEKCDVLYLRVRVK